MSYLILRRASFITLFCIFLFGNTSYAQADTPFIYYYSRQESAFIIERADHTEQRILAAYPLEEEYLGQMAIDGPGWSSSGQYFTWMSRPSEGGGSYAKEVFILNPDTEELETIPTQDNEGIDYIEWSPAEDSLLILSYYNIADVPTPTIEVYNPSEQYYLLSYSSPDIPTSLNQLHWSPDGRYITVSGWNSLLLISVETSELIHLEAEFSTYFPPLPVWLSDGSLAYTRSPNEFVIFDIDAQEQESIILESHNIQMIDWSPDENLALIFATSPELDNIQLYVFSRIDESTTLIADDLAFPHHIMESHWSDDSQYAYYVSDSGESRIISILGDTYTVQPNNEGEIHLDSQIEWASETKLLFIWYVGATYRFELYQYDVVTGELHNLSEEFFSIPQSIYNFSVQNKFLFVGGLFINLETRETIELISTDELLIDTTRTDEFVWHPSGHWIFLLSGSNSLYYVKVANTEGVVSSEIALCPLNSKSCFGWIPNN